MRISKIISILLALVLGSFSAVAGSIDTLYYICDFGDELWSINRTDGGTTDIGDLGVVDCETMAYWPGTETIFTCNAGDFGTVSYRPPTLPGSNLYTFMAEIDGGGTANGADGPQSLDDVDGLSFDPWTGILWASNRRLGQYDLLFQINPNTGIFVPNAFGPGVDYVIIDDTGIFLDIDDIAISPSDGKMYTIATQVAAAQVLEINKYTGDVNAVVGADQPDVEGLAYHNDGTFWGTVGTQDEFWQINPATGVMTNRVDIMDSQCRDPEAVAALVADINTITGTVWNDADYNTIFGGLETGVQNVVVLLYLDVDDNMIYSAGDILIQRDTTDINGDYSFLLAAREDFVMVVDVASLPAGFAFTTPNINATSFTGFGQTDPNNNFGIANGPDCDNDGLPDFAEGGVGVDFDGDGVDNMCDLDSDNDGILDANESIIDSDTDGQPDYLDKDSDNDGIPDGLEATSGLTFTGFDITLGWYTGTDADGDGLLDQLDNAPGVAYGGGSTSTLANPDTDGDGVRDYRDRDSDQDGVLDLLEAGGTDADGNGIIDGFADLDNDGYFDGANFNFLPITNTDSAAEIANGLTLLPDYLDRDSDGDGLTDRVEGFCTTCYPNPIISNDTDGDGVLDVYDTDQGGYASPSYDHDGDGIPDRHDADSDGDGISDLIEGNDANFDQIADSAPLGADTDNDGLDDTFDATPAGWGGNSNVPRQNQDGDSEPDWRDLDNTVNPGKMYYVCDVTNTAFTFNRYNNASSLIGSTGAVTINSTAYWPGNDTLYAANQGNLGWINTATGAFTSFGAIDGGGLLAGSQGNLPITDVTSLTFHSWTAKFYGVQRRLGQNDLLFQIDTATHQFVPNAFGAGVDYVPLALAVGFKDVEDIAVNPATGQMYLAVTAADGTSALIEVNSTTGAVGTAVTFARPNIRGMAFHNDGTLYVTEVGSLDTLWQATTSGAMYSGVDISASCTANEGVAALVAPINTITGTVWDDTDMDMTINGIEIGIPQVAVRLWYDQNGNGAYDGGDILLQVDTTDANGNYSFQFATTANLVMTVDPTTLPAGYSFTTDNLETTVFADNVNFGEVDPNNNFGATNGADCDGDGIADFAEGGVGVDFDGDGVDNMCDLDSDNDGILDSFEMQIDTDGDGQYDYLDLDADNDGIPDAIEANAGVISGAYVSASGRLVGADSDGDGLLDVVDTAPAVPYGPSTSSFANPNSDGDAVRDFRDGDSDNDGILDVIEAGGTDANGDGAIDSFTDANNDGYSDVLTTTPLPITNSDLAEETGYGLPLRPDYIDQDSDYDGISDAIEGQATGSFTQPPNGNDTDGDGIIDFWDVNQGGAPITPVDTDGDNVPDYSDNDSENDSVIDLIEGNDANADGIADSAPSGADTDGDGIDNTFDTTPGVYGGGTNTPHQNTDGDPEDDWRDTDDDDDGINTIDETADINPANGTPDYLEANACGAGFVQANPRSGNADAVSENIGVSFASRTTGAPDGSACTFGSGDTLGLDLTDTVPAGWDIQIFLFQSGGSSSTIGVHESVDGVTWTPPRGSPGTQIVITNSAPPIAYAYTVVTGARYVRIDRVASTVRLDAISYSFTDCLPDKDFDAIPDLTDIDDDNDGITDAIEGVGDFDGDGIPNSCDLDSDNDGLPDALEANSGVMPANMTAEGAYLAAFVAANDANNNGMVDAVDVAIGGTPLADPNTDGDLSGNNDRIDLDSDNDCLPDAMEGNGGSMPANMDGNGQYPVAFATANDTDGDGLIDPVDTDNGGTALTYPDTDGDGAPDYIDTDSDGDGLSDFVEGYDPDIVPSGLDSDGDGIDDASDPDSGGTLPNLPDLDCNGTPDYLDIFFETFTSGNFNVGGTWVGGVVPGIGASIRIMAGHVVTLTANRTVGAVEMLAGANLIPAGFTLHVRGAFTNATPLVLTTGKVVFEGTGCSQDVCGDITFNALGINNSNGVNLTCGTVAISDSLCLTVGVLDVCSATSFTFLSDATGTASIAGTGTGTINCDVVVQRYKTGCVEGYFPLSSCFDINLSDWGDDLLMYGFPNAPNGAGGTPNVVYYNESLAGPVSVGYTAPTDYSNAVPRARGYYIFQGLSNLPVTIEIDGAVNLNPFSFPDATRTANGTPAADGYNYIGNPYPSSIFWNLAPGNGWTSVGCCDAFFVWDECNDQYESWAGGVGVNGATGVVPQGGAFWIKYHLPGASLTINRAAMVTDPGNFKTPEHPNQVLFLDFVAPDGSVDETAIRLVEGAQEMMDLSFDAAKLCSDTTMVREIATVASDANMSMNFAINGLPDNGQNRVVPVVLRSPNTAQHQLKFRNVESFPSDMCIVIEDVLTGEFIDPRVDTAYQFAFVGTPDFTNRFNVHFTYPLEAQGHNETCKGAGDGYGVVSHAGSGPVTYTWMDEGGHVVRQFTTTLGSDTASNLQPGVYTVKVASSGTGYCEDLETQIVIDAPDYPLTASILAKAVGCSGVVDGHLNLVVGGGELPYTYSWSNGAVIQDPTNVAAGQYQVVVTDANGCSVSAAATVNDGAQIEASFAFAADTVNLYYGEFLDVINTSTGASAYVWNFGDGTGNSIDANPSHYYDTAGIYTVNLVAMNGSCNDAKTVAVVVINEPVEGGTGIQVGTPAATEPVTVYNSEYGIVLELHFDAPTDLDVSIMNDLGQVVYAGALSQVAHQVQHIPMAGSATGIYLIRVLNDREQWVSKVVVE